jgi:hypothetical protein
VEFRCSQIRNFDIRLRPNKIMKVTKVEVLLVGATWRNFTMVKFETDGTAHSLRGAAGERLSDANCGDAGRCAEKPKP